LIKHRCVIEITGSETKLVSSTGFGPTFDCSFVNRGIKCDVKRSVSIEQAPT
jgi:hypothetical protein